MNNVANNRVRRQGTATIVSRKLNNFIKSCVLSQYIRCGADVLDLGCGEGEDLLKYRQLNIRSLVGVDVSHKSLQSFERRAKSGENRFEIDLFLTDFTKTFKLNRQFDANGSNFAFQYAFESTTNLHTALSNVTRHLLTEGVFIITVPNAKKIKEIAQGDSCHERLFEIILEGSDRYKFKAIDWSDYCTEKFVDTAVLTRELDMLGLKLIAIKNFHEALEDFIISHETLYNSKYMADEPTVWHM